MRLGAGTVVAPSEGSSGRALGRPVVYRYTPEVSPPGRPLQYGLVAEEVVEVFPDLVQRDPEGRPLSVVYHLLPVLLLNELQRQERELAAQLAQIAELRARLEALEGRGKLVRPVE